MDISFHFGNSPHASYTNLGQGSFRIEGHNILNPSTALTQEFLSDLRKYLKRHTSRGKELEEYLVSLGADHIDIVHGDEGRSLDKLFQEKSFQGAACLSKKHQPILKKGYGKAHDDEHLISSMTTFRLASLTKSFTAVLVLKLAYQKKLSLDDSLEKYFPMECKQNPSWKYITLRMLLNHTSGIKNNPEIVKSENDPLLSSYQAPDHLVKIFAKHDLLFTPGMYYHYSNPGYILLALVIERATHMKYSEAIDEIILHPLGLYYTSAPMDLCDDTPFAKGYSKEGEFSPPPHTSIRIGTGNMISNIYDLEKWLDAIFDPKFLPKEAIEEITRAHPKRIYQNKEEVISYSMGLRKTSIDGEEAYFHTGIFPGCLTMFMTIPAKESKLVMLSNTSFTDKKSFRELGMEVMKYAI